MKVRVRAILILAATLAVFLIILGLVTQSVFLQAFGDIEDREMGAHVQRFVAQVEYETGDVAATCHDWALRDQMPAAFFDGDLGAVDLRQVFPAASMKNLGIDYLMVYNASGYRVFSGTVTADGEVVTSVPPGLDTIVHDSIIPEGMPGGIAGRRGVSVIDGTPLILAGYPIASGNRSGEGTLVMARLLDQERIDNINRMLQMDGSLSPYSPGAADGLLSPQQTLTAKGGGVIVQRSGDDQLTGYALVTGIENKPTFLLLKIETPRAVYTLIKNSILIVTAVLVLLSILYLLVVQQLLQKFILAPLGRLDTGMKSIGESGDLSIRMPETGDDEIVSVVRSNNLMLDRIQSQQQELQALLEEIEQQRDELNMAQQELAERNHDLEELNRKANLYLDIYLDVITYEILNALIGLRGYADLVRSSANEADRKFADKIIDLTRRTADVIRNVETISRIYKNPPEVKEIDLETIVRNEMESRPGAHIVMEQCNRRVLANEMLGVLFDNIFSNSIKFGGKETSIRVSAREIPGSLLEIAVSDTGPGIPDVLKTCIFDRFTKDSKKRSSYGLGLHIVKMLVESYGGTVQAGDRIPGDPSSGAAIRFTLRLAKV